MVCERTDAALCQSRPGRDRQALPLQLPCRDRHLPSRSRPGRLARARPPGTPNRREELTTRCARGTETRRKTGGETEGRLDEPALCSFGAFLDSSLLFCFSPCFLRVSVPLWFKSMSFPEKLPLVTTEIAIGARAYRVTAVQNQDALLDAAEELEHFPYGFLLWESAVGLARWLAADPARVAGRSVLELGAGVGLPGIVAQALGAQVWQTDHQKGALLVARENARQNGVGDIQQFLADWRDWSHST